jgi:hypothetical protein
MNGATDLDSALRLLRGLEEGSMGTAEAKILAQDLDPVLVWATVRYLREVYPASDPAATAVLERVVALTSAWPGLVAKSREGEADPIAGWFASEHAFGEFRGRGAEMIRLVVDKLES